MHALAAALAVAVAGAGLLWQATDGGKALTAEAARRLEARRAAPQMPQVALETMAGEVLMLGADAGRVQLVEFVYTTCPTICQVAGQAMAGLADRVRAEGLGDRLRLISVSFDPSRDDPAALRAYGEGHGADGALWTVARPGAAALPGLLDAFGVVVIEDAWGGYTHNTAIHVVDAAGRLRAITDYDDPAAALAAARSVLQ